MKNIFEVMRQKEAEIQQLQRDIEALRTAARLLAEEGDPSPDSLGRSAGAGSSSMNVAPVLRPATSQAAVPVNKAEVGYSAARENSLRQFP
jgi:type II secretory pathway component PulM